MKFIKDIKTFKAGYSRQGEVFLVTDTCVICEVVKTCIYIDGSEGEYGGASICGDCAKKECAEK